MMAPVESVQLAFGAGHVMLLSNGSKQIAFEMLKLGAESVSVY
jgi:hypothetical protein